MKPAAKSDVIPTTIQQSPQPRPMRLQSETYLAPDIHLYEFRSPDGSAVPLSEPGAHIDLKLGEGLIRSYSVIDQGGRADAYRIAVKHEPCGRGGSRLLHGSLKPGQVIEVSGPRNHFPLAKGARHSVLIAGGIGITPIYAMARRLSDEGCSFDLHYACRSRYHAVFLGELEGLDGTLYLHFDDEVPKAPAIDMVQVVAAVSADAHLYCCGPKPMLDAFCAATANRPDAMVHLEYFSSDIEAASDGGFDVVLARSGQTVRIAPGNTILESLSAAGMDLPSSCLEGVCGSCETEVLEGEPDHRDMVLTASEKKTNTKMMICCSGSRTGRLVLDL